MLFHFLEKGYGPRSHLGKVFFQDFALGKFVGSPQSTLAA
jgi:hypothetical protein